MVLAITECTQSMLLTVNEALYHNALTHLTFLSRRTGL